MHAVATHETALPIPLAYPRTRMAGALGQRDGAGGDESATWLAALRGAPAAREEAIAALHALLLRGARYELGRRRHTLTHLSFEELDDLATQAADDALVAILAKLDTFRGESRFTTWAYKFVLLEAGVRARRRAWHGREVALDADDWLAARDQGPSAQQVVESGELLEAIARRDPDRAHAPSARGLLGAGAQRRADRRARRAAGHDARRAVQDAARRATQAPGGTGRRRLRRRDDRGAGRRTR